MIYFTTIGLSVYLNNMKKYLSLFILLGFLIPSILVAQNTIEIKVGLNGGITYSPKNVTCTVGDTIKFIWQSGNHPTRSDDGTSMPLFGMNSNSTSKTFVFNSPIIIPYYCTAHGDAGGIGMSGTITVNGNASGFANKTLQSSFSVYPNPANEKLSVNFIVKKENTVTIKMIDVLGNDVAQLVNERFAIGEYRQSLNIPSKISKGLYFVKVTVGQDVAIKRISIQ